MPIVNRLAEFQADIAAWRHDFHQHPELLYDVHRTAAAVAERLREFGVDEITTGVGRTGVVAVINGRASVDGPTIALRADMDALPITEATNKSYASTVSGKMHACGHDGHTAMLLGAARYLAETRNFAGRVVLVFQPAEEGGGGGKAMVEDGLFERWGIEEIYGMHNMPGIDIGSFAIRPGAMMASTDRFVVTITGRGAHAAEPHRSIDPIPVGAAMVQALQTIVSRTVNPISSAVVTVTKFHAGTAFNIIPETAEIAGTVRTLDGTVRDLIERRIRTIVAAVADQHEASAAIEYTRTYPVLKNWPAQTDFACQIAAGISGKDFVRPDTDPIMGGEDFSWMLEGRPGAYIFVGNGDSAGLHNPRYDFNDDVIPVGCSYWVKLVETRLAR